nr:putative disease resistance protein At3g14460 [Setaria viridis]
MMCGLMNPTWKGTGSNFPAPLASKQRGSKILVTSRCNVFPAALCCQEVFDLQDMEDSAFLTLLGEHAFSGAEIRDAQLRMNLEEIAKKRARRLGQSPLAAKTVGSQLSRKKDVTTWTAALRSDNLSEPMRVLLWSYEKLDPRLQRCFLYCSLFPKGHKYTYRKLVHLWTAEGFIDLSSQNRRMEDIGSNYLNELIACSFLQPGSDRFGLRCYIMHDLLHDLAEKLSRDDCFRLEDDDMAEIPCTVRHLSVHVKSMKQHKQSICKLRHLRTVICIGPLVDDADDVFHQVLQNLKRLRVLYMRFYNKEKLPESVGGLKHLRYLNVIQTTISEFPASLCTLYHLQILLFSYRVQSLPKKLCNLSKLLSFEPYRKESYRKRPSTKLPQIPYIGKLTSLQKLDQFRVQKQKGYEPRQLRDMNELSGRLSITRLENVTRKDEAAEMMLHKKRYLKFLRLIWSNESDSHAEDSLHLDILEGLRPPAQLEGLSIAGYKSDRFPSWNNIHYLFDAIDGIKHKLQALNRKVEVDYCRQEDDFKFLQRNMRKLFRMCGNMRKNRANGEGINKGSVCEEYRTRH